MNKDDLDHSQFVGFIVQDAVGNIWSEICDNREEAKLQAITRLSRSWEDLIENGFEIAEVVAYASH